MKVYAYINNNIVTGFIMTNSLDNNKMYIYVQYENLLSAKLIKEIDLDNKIFTTADYTGEVVKWFGDKKALFNKLVDDIYDEHYYKLNKIQKLFLEN